MDTVPKTDNKLTNIKQPATQGWHIGHYIYWLTAKCLSFLGSDIKQDHYKSGNYSHHGYCLAVTSDENIEHLVKWMDIIVISINPVTPTCLPQPSHLTLNSPTSPPLHSTTMLPHDTLKTIVLPSIQHLVQISPELYILNPLRSGKTYQSYFSMSRTGRERRLRPGFNSYMI